MSKYLENYKYIILTLALVVLLSYWGTWNSFFVQDQWAGFANILRLDGSHIENLNELIRNSASNYRVLFLTPIFNYIRFLAFGFNYSLYSIFSIVIHIFNTLLVFLLFNKVLKNKKVSLVGATFFAINTSISQAVSWISTSIPTLFSTLFSIIAIYLYLQSDRKINQKAILSIVFAVIAFNFKETSLLVFMFIFIDYLYYKLKVHYSLIIFIYISLLGTLLLLYNSFGNILKFIKIVSLAISQIIFPEKLLYLTAKFITYLILNPVPFANVPVTTERISIPILTFIIASIVLFYIYRNYRSSKKHREIITFSLIWFFSGIFPLFLIPKSELSATFLPSRNLYLLSIGLIVLIGMYAYKSYKRKSNLYMFMLILFVLHGTFNQLSIRSNIEIGTQRKEILNAISEKHPTLTEKTIFYTQSDQSYYGLPVDVKIMPFQSGFGNTILVWYSKEDRFPPEFYATKYLWEIDSEGYKEVDGRGFGYVRSYDSLLSLLKENNLNSENVIAYYWQGRLGALSDITEEVREQVNKDLE